MKETRLIGILFVLFLSWLIPSFTTTTPLTLAATQERASLLTHLSPHALSTPATAGTITEFPLPTLNSGPAFITTGPDGNLWFAEFLANQIGKITVGGSISEFLLGRNILLALYLVLTGISGSPCMLQTKSGV